MNLYKCSRAMYNIQQPPHQLNIQHSSVHRGKHLSSANQQQLWSLLEKITEVKWPFLPL